MQNPNNKLFGHVDFSPREVGWDPFGIDPRAPLLPQMHEFNQDLMWVEFSNGCSLHIDRVAHPGRTSYFVASLTQLLPGEE